MGAITACRTAVLGGHVEQCDDCGATRIAYNSCRNRHCPEVPGTGTRRMARGATSRAAAGAVLPCRLHPAGAGRRDRLPEQGRRLRDPVPRRGRDARHHRRRSQASRRADRRHRGAPHLGPDPAAPSARPLRRARRRPLARRHALDRLPPRLLPAGARALAPVPPPVPARPAERLRRRQAGLLRQPRRPCRAHGLRQPSRRNSGASNGSSMPSHRSAAPNRCWPISAATPIASPSPTAG